MTSETELFHDAIKHWWRSKSSVKSNAQGGTRDLNLHGKTMDGFAAAIRTFLIGLGVKPDHIFAGKYEPGHDGKPVSIKQPHFLAMHPFRVDGSNEKETFDGPSYAERYKIFMRQSVGARLYDAGAFIVTDEKIKGKRTNHRILLPEFGPANFLRSLKAQILAHYPGAKAQRGSIASQI